MVRVFLEWYKYNLIIFQAFSLFISFIFLALIIYFNIVLNLTGEKISLWLDVLGAKNITRRRSLKVWTQIQRRLKAGDPKNLRMAILEADRILEELLKIAGYPGRTLDEQLAKIIPNQIPAIEQLRLVHKLRNRIIAEPDFSPDIKEAEEAIKVYKIVFQDLGLLSED
jgi:hypothetical protein